MPDLLKDFVINGALPSASCLADAAAVPTLMLGEALQHLREATAANRGAGGSDSNSSSSDASSHRDSSTITGISSSHQG